MLELSIMNHGPRFVEEVRALLAQFEQDTRSEVNLRVLEWRDAWAELVKVALYNDGPHVSEIGNTWLSEFVSMSALRPFIGSEVARFGGAQQFLPSAWHSITPAVNSQVAVMTWAAPWLADMRLIHYRQDLFEQAGIDPHTAFQSPQTLLETCARLQAAGVTHPVVLPTRQSRMTLHNLAGWVWGNGGDFTSPDGKKVLFVTERAKAAIYAYFDLARHIPPEVRRRDEYQSDASFLQGDAALTISGPWLHLSPDASPEVAAKIRQALLSGTPYIGGSHLVIWKSISPRLERLAVELVRFLTERRIQLTCSQQVGLLPVRNEVLRTPPFSTEPFYQVLSRGLQTGRSFPAMRLWGLIEDRLVPALGNIWQRVLAEPEPALDAIIQSELEPLAQRLNQTLDMSRHLV